MTRARLWLVLSAALFLGWIAWLAYLVLDLRRETAAGQGRPVVLSQPQFLIATLVVSGEVEENEAGPATVRVKEVHWPENEQTRKLPGERIAVGNLARSEGFAGAGTYLMPLLPEEGSYRVAPMPPSPGYPAGGSRAGPPRVYPDTPHLREKLGRLRAELEVP